MRVVASLCLLFAAGLPAPAPADESVDWEMATRIRYEGLHHSQAAALLEELCDGYGSRITASPDHEGSIDWALAKLEEWGLANARREAFEFGPGWDWQSSRVEVVHPWRRSLESLPIAWMPGTEGTVSGPLALAGFESDADLDSLEGQLGGKLLLVDEPREFTHKDDGEFVRHDHDSLEDLCGFDLPDGGPGWRERWQKTRVRRHRFLRMCAEEGALGLLQTSSRENSIVRGTSYVNVLPDSVPGLPAAFLTAEDYARLHRRVSAGDSVVVELEVEARFHEGDGRAHNAFAELPGRGKGIVMAGAHLDSWHGATGATDNAAGVVVVMEALRILKQLGVQPERTIRVALWGGEEQGLVGSYNYVQEHVASRPWTGDDLRIPGPASRPERWPLSREAEFDRLSAYFNLDNGAGRIRGIYAQGNSGVVPVFEQWLRPYHDLGATTVTQNSTSSTDHMPFDRVGVPAFQFIQDPLEYFPRTHHSNLDVLEHVPADDLRVSATVLAGILWQVAQREDRLPRKPFPTEERDGR